jgi:hypothetical protein
VKWFASYEGLASFDDKKTDGATAVQISQIQPQAVKIIGNYPNPFNPQTVIQFVIPTESQVSMNIYSITGQRVRELVSGRISAGSHTVFWDGKDDAGKSVSAGVYVSRLSADGHSALRKMLLMK